MRLAAGNNFYLRLTFEKMHAPSVFNDQYLESYGCSDINFTATVKYTNTKAEIKSKTIEIQIDFVI